MPVDPEQLKYIPYCMQLLTDITDDAAQRTVVASSAVATAHNEQNANMVESSTDAWAKGMLPCTMLPCTKTFKENKITTTAEFESRCSSVQGRLRNEATLEFITLSDAEKASGHIACVDGNGNKVSVANRTDTLEMCPWWSANHARCVQEKNIN